MGKKIVVFLVAAVLLAGALGAGSYLFMKHLLGNPNQPGAPVIVYDLKPGTSFWKMTQELEDLGVWKSAKLVRLYAKINKRAARIKIGEYEISGQQSPRQILELFTSGKGKPRVVTIPEGDNIVDVANAVELAGLATKDVFLRAARNPELIQKYIGVKADSFEGYLFPETYNFSKYTTVESILQAMVAQFESQYQRALAEVPASERPSRIKDWDRHRIVTMASLIEKETGAPQERPMISSVFFNRLDQGMKLQTDPTILYGKFVASGSMPNNISKADLLAPSTYNTYVIFGLPPGPICNPGLDAMKAALRPVISKNLFFVSKNDGTHVFTENYKAHEKAVNFYQKDARQRQGKSWRDLKK
ncbi:MAG: endolytic transglycosylase MltG [Bdellovibrionota bacterium]